MAGIAEQIYASRVVIDYGPPGLEAMNRLFGAAKVVHRHLDFITLPAGFIVFVRLDGEVDLGLGAARHLPCRELPTLVAGAHRPRNLIIEWDSEDHVAVWEDREPPEMLTQAALVYEFSGS